MQLRSLRYGSTLLYSAAPNDNSLKNIDGRILSTNVWMIMLLAFLALAGGRPLLGASNRSGYIQYDSNWITGPSSKWIALDTAHQQVFTGWPGLDRIDVLSTVDYHLIHSILVPSPSTLDISPDGSTLAVGTTASHILFFDTATFAKTNDIVFPGAALGISAFLYTANGNAMIRAEEGLAGGGGITAYWDHAANSFQVSNIERPTTAIYQTTGPLARSGDYSKIMLGDSSTAGSVQIIDGNSGKILWDTKYFGFGGYIYALAANKDGSRYAVCATQSLVILDSSFQQIYQDQVGCLGMTFSADGNTLYRDISVKSSSYTQALDMNTFAARNVPNYFTSQNSSDSGFSTFWEASDTTGMIYGVKSDVLNGIIWMALDTNASTVPQIPPVNDPVQILRVIDNIGSPQGGDSIRLLCTGVDSFDASSISVTIGAAPATTLYVGAPLPPILPNLPNQRIVTVKTPAGAGGLADVVVSTNAGSSTAPKAFQYASSRTIIPFVTSPTFLLYDSLRNKLYAAHKDEVEVIDVAGQRLLSPLFPASGKLQNSRFAGLSLSPDGNRLYIADGGAKMIHELDLTNPGQGFSIDVGNALGSSSPLPPARVFELSTGKLLGTVLGDDVDVTGGVFLIDPQTSSGEYLKDTSGNSITGYTWASTNKGENVLISSSGNGLISSNVGLWNAYSSNYAAPSSETQWIEEADANEDGTVIIAGGSTPGIQSIYPEIVDFNLYPLGLIEQHFDAVMPAGTPSFFLHPSGALLYKAGSSVVGASVEIDDLHQFQPAATVTFPEPFVESYSPITDHMLTTDSTGRYLFGVTKSGITIMALNHLPLSIGNIQPEFIQSQSSQTITIRGSGFLAGATVSIGGMNIDANYVDENTLTVVTSALPSGWEDITVTLPSGASYTAAGLLHVIGAQPTPAVTGFSPASFVVQSGISGFDTTANIKILGSGFEAYDMVTVNGGAVASAFIDSSHIQATLPANLTGHAGSVSVAVISPYNGPSNDLALPMINPIPVLQNNSPITVVPGNGLGLNLYGTGFVAGSTIQWDGQNLATSLSGGQTSSGLGSVFTFVPASLTAQDGTADVTVFNPGPGGGTSNTLYVDISPAHPVILLSVGAPGKTPVPYYTLPTTLDLGRVVLNASTTYVLYIQNTGTGPYVFSSADVTSGPFSVQNSPCNALSSRGDTCIQTLTFTPTIPGSATATLTLTDNVTGSPHTIELTGAGIQTPVPAVTLNAINALGQTTTATVIGNTIVGGPTVQGTAWIEYGTDRILTTFSKSPSWSITGDSALSGNLSGLEAGALYAARLAVQTSGGIGRSGIQLFATAPAWPTVSMSSAPGTSSTASIVPGQTANYSLIASGGGYGYHGIATFSCDGAPTGAACNVSPSEGIVSAAAIPITVTVTTTGKTVAQGRRASNGLNWALALLFGTGSMAFRKRLRKAALFSCLCILTFSLSSCGASGGNPGGGFGSGSGGNSATATPAGTYLLTVTAVTEGIKNNYLLTLKVQ